MVAGKTRGPTRISFSGIQVNRHVHIDLISGGGLGRHAEEPRKQPTRPQKEGTMRRGPGSEEALGTDGAGVWLFSMELRL